VRVCVCGGGAGVLKVGLSVHYELVVVWDGVGVKKVGLSEGRVRSSIKVSDQARPARS
jgi:hypothetical protein